MKQIPYWVDSLPPTPSYANRDLPERADVVVIGGGLTGLSAALHLARKGAQVTVLERNTMGSGASSRNGGQCNPGITVSPKAAIRRWGMEKARKLYQISLDAVDFVEKLVQEEGIECEFRRCGRLGLAYKPKHLEQLRAKQALLAREFNHETVLVSPEEQQCEIGTDFYHGGLLDPLGAALHPGKLVVGLAVAAERAGADLHEGVAALDIQRTGNGSFTVQHSRGVIRAKQILMATNGYTDQIHKKLKRRLLPIGSFIIATEPLPEELVKGISPRGRNMVDTKNYPYFFRLSSDNRLLFGGRARFALSNPESDRKSGKVLKEGMTAVFPQLSGVEIEYVWGGTVAFTLDRMPHAGEMDGIHYSAGYCGHGVQNATYMGKCMSEVMDGHPEANPWKELDFPPVPYAMGWTWILPFAGAYYKILDWLT